MGINMLSLFNGYSGAMLGAERAGIEVDNFYSSEIDKYANIITQKNYPDVIQLGDALNYENWDLQKIDLLVGGSPCQDLSRIKSKDAKGLDGEKSKLFYTFFAALRKFKPKYFMLENVVMDKEYEDIITELLEVEPILINSNCFSAQNRPRLYWTNINVDKNIEECDLKIKDILEGEVDDKYYYDLPFKYNGEEKNVIANLITHKENGKRIFTDTTSRVYNINSKAPTLTAVSGGHQEKKVFVNERVRKLTPLEYERLQTLPDGYTEGVSNSQRYKMLGNGWTVDVIAHIFGGMKK